MVVLASDSMVKASLRSKSYSFPIVDLPSTMHARMSHRMIQSVLRPPYSTIPSSDALLEQSLRRRSPLLQRLFLQTRRHLSSSSHHAHPQKPTITPTLEKPDKFRPPSHPSRLNARRVPRHYQGPPLPEAEKEAQMTRKYPHMFPNEGTRMHWFLTNKSIHLWISLVRLTCPSILLL